MDAGITFVVRILIKVFVTGDFVQVKSVLDPCGDENDDIEDEEVSLCVDSVQRDESSDSDTEVK